MRKYYLEETKEELKKFLEDWQKTQKLMQEKSNPNNKKININSASIKELGQFYYFKYPISKNIVTYRSMNGDIKIEDLSNIKGFPVDKLKIIALYLEF
jgi:DNA uptake protein ComE-like DNA-binding protein